MKSYLLTLDQANILPHRTDFSRSQNPVLLLYGFGATRRSLALLEDRLREEGFDVFSLKLGGFLDHFNTHRVDDLARLVAQRIESLYSRYPLPKMAIIGFSKGGLIGLYYLLELYGYKKMHTLITLATPHRGIPKTLFTFFSKSVRQMRPSSPMIRLLQSSPIPKETYVVSISSNADRICPSPMCQLSEQDHVKNVEIEGLGHSDFVIKIKAFKEIQRHLKIGKERNA